MKSSFYCWFTVFVSCIFFISLSAKYPSAFYNVTNIHQQIQQDYDTTIKDEVQNDKVPDSVPDSVPVIHQEIAQNDEL